jgi:glycosyltransferase involved in cell wall biosynthesis
MNIAIITDSFPPLKNSGAVQVMDLALEFIRQGNKVTVITPSSEIIANFLIDSLENIEIIRLKAPKIRGVSYIRRVIGEFLMPFAMIFNLKLSSTSICKFDGVVTYAPSIFLGPVAKRIKKKSECKNYLIIRDIFPQWAVDLGLISHNSVPYYFFKLVEKNLYSTADIIGTQTLANMPYFKKEILGNVTLDVLHNWWAVNKSKTCSILVENSILKGRKIFVYAGNMGDAQFLSIFIDLAAYLQTDKSIGFLFVGRGNAVGSLRQDVKARRLDNILIYDEIEPQEIHALYQQCDVGIISLDKRHTTHNIPGKFLSYMQSGLPVLAAINSGNDLEHIINNNKVGCVSTIHTVDELKKLVEEIVENLLGDDDTKKRCLKLYRDMFSPKKAVEQIINGLV